MGFCVQCRFEEVGSYCRVCGSHLVDMDSWNMKCGCGETVCPWNYYCPNCGRVITMDAIILYLEDRDEKAMTSESIGD